MSGHPARGWPLVRLGRRGLGSKLAELIGRVATHRRRACIARRGDGARELHHRLPIRHFEGCDNVILAGGHIHAAFHLIFQPYFSPLDAVCWSLFAAPTAAATRPAPRKSGDEARQQHGHEREQQPLPQRHFISHSTLEDSSLTNLVFAPLTSRPTFRLPCRKVSRFPR